MLNLRDFKENLNGKNPILFFEGKFSQLILTDLLEKIKNKLDENHSFSSEKIRIKIIKQFYTCIIELAQNIQKHSLEKNNENSKKIGKGVILIKEDKDFFYISSENYIENIYIEKLQENVNQINSLSRLNLKKFYKRKLRTPFLKKQNGAAVGLITIVKKTGNPIDLVFKKIDKYKSWVTITAKIGKCKIENNYYSEAKNKQIREK